MGVKRVQRTADFEPSDGGLSVVRLVQQFAMVRREKAAFEKRERELKSRLSEIVEDEGYEDDKGNFFIDLPASIPEFSALKREKYVKQTLNEERALAVLAERSTPDDDLVEFCTKTITVIDEDALMQAYFQEKITDSDIDSIISKEVNYRFVPQKRK